MLGFLRHENRRPPLISFPFLRGNSKKPRFPFLFFCLRKLNTIWPFCMKPSLYSTNRYDHSTARLILRSLRPRLGNTSCNE